MSTGAPAGRRSGDRPALLVMANPNAGNVDDGVIGRVLRALSDDATVEVAVTPGEDHAGPVLDRLDGRRLVLVGGDGTLNVACNHLHDRGALGGAPIAFVPAGTANAFARALDIPLQPEAAARLALTGSPRPLDLIAGDGRVAANDLHTGLGVPATELSRRLKRWVGPLAYPVANGLTGLRTLGWPVTVDVDGRRVVDGDRTLAVAIGNTELIGDGTPMWPGARPDDGLLDVLVLLAGDRRSRLTLARDVQRGRHPRRDDARLVQGAEVRVSGHLPGYNADGELWPAATDTTWRVVPRGWSLVR